MDNIKIKSFKEIKPLKNIIKERNEKIKKEQEEKTALNLSQISEKSKNKYQTSEDEKLIFLMAVKNVTPLKKRGADERTINHTKAKPQAAQREKDESQALKESISDDFDPSTLLHTDGDLSYTRQGVGFDVISKLRRGNWSVQAELDLHGLRTDQAREALGEFLQIAGKKGIRCVRIIHGKGHGSLGKIPVLKNKVQTWLVQRQQVMAFVQAKPLHGGAGALVVLLS